MKFVAYATIKGDEMILSNKDKLKKFLTVLKYKTKDETKIKLTLERDIKPRTSGKEGEPSNQNGYWWAYVIPPIADYCGYTNSETHEALKMKFLRQGGSDKLPLIGSTAELNKLQWEDLMEQVRIWALTDLGVKIPLPNETEQYDEEVRDKKLN